jgi:NAD(P)-dependent dehydrogenase (short-subunit alcohol dehydrogenase family)
MPANRSSDSLNVGIDLGGKVAVITGGAGGIGRRVALRFAGAGASVVVADQDAAALRDTSSALRQGGWPAESVFADVRDPRAVERIFQTAAETFGRVDIVVLSAGVRGVDTPIERISDEAWSEAIAVNLSGAFFGIRAAVPHLRAAGGGKIIVLGSAAAQRAPTFHGTYAASFGGVSVLVRVAARDLRRYRIAVNELQPGPTATAMAGVSATDPDTLAKRQVVLDEGLEDDQSIAGEWFKSPENVADLAMYLVALPDRGPSGQTFSLNSA